MSEEKELLELLENRMKERDNSLTSLDEVDEFILLTPEALLDIENYQFLDDEIVKSLIFEYKTERTIASA